MWDPLRPKCPKNTKTRISGEKKENMEKKTIRKRLDRGTLNTCPKIQGLSLKNGVDIVDSEGILGFMVEPACIHCPYLTCPMDVVPTSSNGVNAEADVHGVDPRNIFFSTRQRDAAAFLARF